MKLFKWINHKCICNGINWQVTNLLPLILLGLLYVLQLYKMLSVLNRMVIVNRINLQKEMSHLLE